MLIPIIKYLIFIILIIFSKKMDKWRKKKVMKNFEKEGKEVDKLKSSNSWKWLHVRHLELKWKFEMCIGLKHEKKLDKLANKELYRVQKGSSHSYLNYILPFLLPQTYTTCVTKSFEISIQTKMSQCWLKI